MEWQHEQEDERGGQIITDYLPDQHKNTPIANKQEPNEPPNLRAQFLSSFLL